MGEFVKPKWALSAAVKTDVDLWGDTGSLQEDGPGPAKRPNLGLASGGSAMEAEAEDDASKRSRSPKPTSLGGAGGGAPAAAAGRGAKPNKNKDKERGQAGQRDATKLGGNAVIIKSLLNLFQRMRLAESLLDTDLWMSDRTVDVAKVMRGSQIKYSNAVKEKGREHGLGPPGPQVWTDLVEYMSGPGGVDVGAKNRAAWAKEAELLAGASSPQDILVRIPLCRITRAYDESKAKILINVKELELRELLRSSFEQLGLAERLCGQAPRGPLERDLEALLKSLKNKA